MTKNKKTSVQDFIDIIDNSEEKDSSELWRHGLDSKRGKPTTKLQQTHNKLTTELTTKLQQTHNKPTTESPRKVSPDIKTYNKVTTQPTTNLQQNLQQSYNKVTTNEGFLALVGLQSQMVKFIYNLCRSNGSRITGPIAINQLSEFCKTTDKSAQMTSRRLIKKGFLIRESYKNGRGGWTKYSLPKDLYNELFNLETYNKPTTKLEQSYNKPPTQPTTQPTTNFPSSSSGDLIIKKTTTTKEDPLGEDWIKVELPEILKNNRISEKIIFQCRDRNILSPSSLQESLNAFAFDISENKVLEKKKIQNPQAWLMHSLSKNGGYAPPLNYVSDEEKAEKEMLERLEARNKEKSERKARIVELKFKEWAEGLSQAEKNELKPAMAKNTYGPMFEATLKNHFLANIIQES